MISAFPEGSQLVRRAVPIESGAAGVDLSAEVLTGTTFLRRQQMQQQLELTLGELNTVSTVRMTVDQREVDLGGGPDPQFQAAVTDPAVGNVQIGILNDELVFYEGSRPVKPEGLPSVGRLEPARTGDVAEPRALRLLDRRAEPDVRDRRGPQGGGSCLREGADRSQR